MNNLIPINELFRVEYGNKLDLNKMKKVEDKNGVFFVSRSEEKLGISTVVKPVEGISPYPAGLITVALGGSMLASFVQQKPFYTAQNIAVLYPLRDMTLKEKIFYCLCIRKNRFRYSTFGREANRTLPNLLVPEKPPAWVQAIPTVDYGNLSEPIQKQSLTLRDRRWKWFRYDYLFDIKKGKRITNSQMKDGDVPCIRPISYNNGVFKHITIKPNHEGNTITVSYNGSVGEAFYQPKPHFSLDDINVLYPKFKMNIYLAMFLITLIGREKYRFNYGRKWHLDRMNESKIKLPTNELGEPDWVFIEKFVKGLRYSKGVSEKLT